MAGSTSCSSCCATRTPSSDVSWESFGSAFMAKFDLRWVALAILGLASLGGCASGGGVDPWEKTNRFFYQLNDGIDKYALKPAADGYVKVVPQPIREGLDNAFNNLDYFNVILND